MPELNTIAQHFKNAPGFNIDAFIIAHEVPAVNSFRINTKKIDKSPYKFSISVPWCSDGFYVTERPKYAQHPFWHSGAIYVQEASSMFLNEALKQLLPLQEKIFVLDACAAPGGKSTLIAALLSADSVLVSNEVIKSRVNVLQENLTRWGNGNSIITNCDSIQFSKLPPTFDCIVVDAPCSGSGLFRKDPNALNEWSENNVQLCSERQQRILSNLIPSLKSNGILVYSTCSYSIEENEIIVDWLCNQHQMEVCSLCIPSEWNVFNSQPGCYRFYPNNIQGEGFFISILRKKSDVENQNKVIASNLKLVKPESSFTQYLREELKYFMHNETLYALTETAFEVTELLRQYKINLVRCGVELGEHKGSKFIPAHALALNEVLNSNLEKREVDEATAIQYLKKETIHIDGPLGFKLLQFKGVPIGWINVMQNRSNNMYPTAWRLLH